MLMMMTMVGTRWLASTYFPINDDDGEYDHDDDFTDDADANTDDDDGGTTLVGGHLLSPLSHHAHSLLHRGDAERAHIAPPCLILQTNCKHIQTYCAARTHKIASLQRIDCTYCIVQTHTNRHIANTHTYKTHNMRQLMQTKLHLLRTLGD